MYADPEAKKEIAKFQAARAKMTEEEKADEVDDVCKRLVITPKRRKPEGPYEVDTTEEADMTEQGLSGLFLFLGSLPSRLHTLSISSAFSSLVIFACVA